MKTKIQYHKRNEIDDRQWDQCISQAPNGLIYAYSYYLDAMCTHWDALVWNNYEAVMPLPWRKKWGIRYLYQPAFTAQLGIFGKDLTASLMQKFFNSIPHKFRYWDIVLNYQNLFFLENYVLYRRNNYVLPLHHSYDQLYSHYRQNNRRNIKKAHQNGCSDLRMITIHDVLCLAEKNMARFGVTQEDFIRFTDVYQQLHSRQQAYSYGVFDLHNQLLASCVFLFSHGRAYYILAGNHAAAKATGASHALIDSFIRQKAGTNLLLDFEGGDSPSLAFFYSGFGAVNQEYTAIKLNRLPLPLRWLKK